MTNIVILTGAGISAESGLGTFRSEDGLWAQHRIEDVATPEGFMRDPVLVHNFYNARRENCLSATPNAAHDALAKLQAKHDGRVTIVTQNIDDLHERAGSSDVLHMHGEVTRALCSDCDHRWDAPIEMAPSDTCPSCLGATTRPDIVWFGEMPYLMEEIYGRLSDADLFVAVGTSGNVYPAAGFVSNARDLGAQTLELNLEPSSVNSIFDTARFGKATEVVPAWVADVLAGRTS